MPGSPAALPPAGAIAEVKPSFCASFNLFSVWAAGRSVSAVAPDGSLLVHGSGSSWWEPGTNGGLVRLDALDGSYIGALDLLPESQGVIVPLLRSMT